MSMKTFVVQTSDSTDSESFKKILLQLKSVEQVDVLEKENWQMPGRPATEEELEAMAIEAEQAGFVSIAEVKKSINTLYKEKLKHSKK